MAAGALDVSNVRPTDYGYHALPVFRAGTMALRQGPRAQHNCHEKYISSKCTNNYLAAGLYPNPLAGFYG